MISLESEFDNGLMEGCLIEEISFDLLGTDDYDVEWSEYEECMIKIF